MPAALAKALKIEELSTRYGRLPSEIEREGLALLRHVNIVELGAPKKGATP